MEKSIIKKTITRKIRTADFEQLDIGIEVEEQIVWETEEERTEATKKLTGKLMDDFIETYNEVVNKVGVDRCIGTVKIKGKKNETKSQSDDMMDFNF